MRGRDPNDPRRWRDDDERRSQGSEEDWRDEWRPGESRWREERGGFGYGNYGSAGGYGPYGGGYDRRFGRQYEPDDWQSRVDWHGRAGGYENESYDPYENRAWRRDWDRDRFRARRGEGRGLLERAGDWLQRKLGKAPKGYTRSDDRIREDLSEVVWRRGDIDASDVEIVVKNAEVTLVGNVNDRRTKRLLEDMAEDCLGVIDVHNQIKIRREAHDGNRERAATTGSSTMGTTTGTTRTPRA